MEVKHRPRTFAPARFSLTITLKSLQSFSVSNFIFKEGNHCIIIATLWSDTSASLHCRSPCSLAGPYCEKCAKGHFGDPKNGCKCSGLEQHFLNFHLICCFYWAGWDKTQFGYQIKHSGFCIFLRVNCTFYVLGWFLTMVVIRELPIPKGPPVAK